MATYPASGTVESNFGLPQGSLNPVVSGVEYIVDADAATTAKFVTGDIINIASLPANTVILGGQAEVLEASVGGTAVPVTIAINGGTVASFATTAINTVGNKSTPTVLTSNILSTAANLTFTMGTVTGTVTKNGKFKIRLFVIKPL